MKNTAERPVIRSLMFVVVLSIALTRTVVATAEESQDKGIEPAQEVVADEPLAGRPADATPGPGRRLAATPAYTADWDHLIEMIHSDEVVLGHAAPGITRRKLSGEIRWLGGLLGGGTAAVSTFVRLRADDWSSETKWGVVTGLSMGVVSFLVAWAVAPDRRDFITVINEWNLRHEDRPISP